MKRTIEDLAQEWLGMDRDPITSQEIRDLLSQGNSIELENRLRTRIAFGTAGLRAAMGAGFSRMNALTVIQASQGLAVYLQKHVSDPSVSGVVIGRDARHNSETFAKLAAAAFLAKGFKVWFLDLVHTPMVPFAVSTFGAAAGIMVTASHNPAADNGYKVYWQNGCQIIPPHDRGIAEAIDLNLEPQTWDATVVNYQNVMVIDALKIVRARYIDIVTRTAALSPSSSVSIPVVYTPMHGVGLPFFMDVARALGVGGDVTIVEAQAKPDPTFPTVKFPNPEEKGALDLAIGTANECGSTLILANDPDADRFAVAEKVEGSWRQLTGNQLGILFASHMLDEYVSKHGEASKKQLAMLASTVSSTMLACLAKAEGFYFEETLTGFKWLGNKAIDLDAAGYNAVYAYEEAIGFMFSQVVWDKDGIAAAAVFLAACQIWRAAGFTPWAKLQALYKRYGYFEEANTYLVSPSPAVTNSIFENIRGAAPTHVGNRRISRWRDLTKGYDTAMADRVPVLPVDKSAQMISCQLEGGVAFTVRGSGTEPKIKVYIEGSADSAAKAKAAATGVLEDLISDWFQPTKYGLRRA